MPVLHKLSDAISWTNDMVEREIAELSAIKTTMARLISLLGCLTAPWHAGVACGQLNFAVYDPDLANTLKDELEEKLSITLRPTDKHFGVWFKGSFEAIIVTIGDVRYSPVNGRHRPWINGVALADCSDHYVTIDRLKKIIFEGEKRE